MKDIQEKSVGEIVAEDFRTAQVFEKYQIDFCCNGGDRLREVAAQKELDTQFLIREITKIQEDNTGEIANYESWPLDLLADYIVKTHHRYSDKKIQEIKPYLTKITNVHGDRHPELYEIKDTFDRISGEIAAHTKKEELIVFPFIKQMVQAEEKKEEFKNPAAKTAHDPINMLTHEHDNQGNAFKKMAKLSNNYTNPSDGCNTYRVTLGLLKEFQQDLHKHIHLENNILFPKALELEKKWAIK